MPTLASITRVPGDFYSTSHNSTFEHIVNKVERACFLRAHVGTWSLITICLTKAENRDILIMDGILPSLLAFPPHPAPVTPLSDAEYDKQAKNIVQILSYTGSKSLINGVSGGGDLLEILNPSTNSLPYLFVLLAHIDGPQAQGSKLPVGVALSTFPVGGQLWAKMLEFMECFDPLQIRYAGSSFPRLVEIVYESAKLASQSALAIKPIKNAILRLDPTGCCLTLSHLIFARLCLEVREFRAALPVLDHDILRLPSRTQKGASTSIHQYPCSSHEFSSEFITTASGLSGRLDYRDHLKYFVYSGMIYMALKNWERGILFLEIAIMSPTNHGASMIQVEAYKKWVLVNLLFQGKLSPIPKPTNPQATKIIKAMAKAYDNLADVFSQGISKEMDATRLIAECTVAQPIWREDSNVGLVTQVIRAYRRFSVIKLRDNYVAMKIAEVARRTSPDPTAYEETAIYVSSLISSGHLNATVILNTDNHSQWIVRFAELDPEELACMERSRLDALAKQMDHTSALVAQVKGMDQRMSLTKEYLEHEKKAQKDKNSATNRPDISTWQMSADDFNADEEDIMGGM